MRPALLLAAALSLCACQGEAATPAMDGQDEPPETAAPTGFADDPSGVYQRSDPAAGRLEIRHAGAGYRLSLVAAGAPDGPGTAADCQLEAEGPMLDDRIVGTLVPFESDTGGLTAAEVGTEPGTLTVVIDDDGSAQVSEEGASGRLCGLGSDVSGTYVRAG